MQVLRAKDVSVRYRSAGELSVADASFAIASGEIVALTGDNGAGKSTLIRVLNGSLRPSSGQVFAGSTDVTDRPDFARKMTATMWQTNNPVRGMTPRQAVTNAALLRGMSLSQARSRCNEIFSALNMGNVADTAGELLSGGMRRLTNFATAVVQGTPVVLLDEPTNDVDPSRRPLLWSVVSFISKQGQSVLVSTHNIAEASRYTTRQIIMSHGGIVYDGSANDVLSENQWTFADVPADVVLPKSLGGLVVDRGSEWITLAIPGKTDSLSHILEELRTVAQSVTVRQNRSFESIFEAYREQKK